MSVTRRSRDFPMNRWFRMSSRMLIAGLFAAVILVQPGVAADEADAKAKLIEKRKQEAFAAKQAAKRAAQKAAEQKALESAQTVTATPQAESAAKAKSGARNARELAA